MEKIGMPGEEIYSMDDEETVCIDLGDLDYPVMVDSSEWVSLGDAESLYELLGIAIAAVKERASGGKKSPQSTNDSG